MDSKQVKKALNNVTKAFNAFWTTFVDTIKAPDEKPKTQEKKAEPEMQCEPFDPVNPIKFDPEDLISLHATSETAVDSIYKSLRAKKFEGKIIKDKPHLQVMITIACLGAWQQGKDEKAFSDYLQTLEDKDWVTFDQDKWVMRK